MDKINVCPICHLSIEKRLDKDGICLVCLSELATQRKLDRILEKEIRLRKQEQEELEQTKDAPDRGSVQFGGVPMRRGHWRIGRSL